MKKQSDALIADPEEGSLRTVFMFISLENINHAEINQQRDSVKEIIQGLSLTEPGDRCMKTDSLFFQ